MYICAQHVLLNYLKIEIYNFQEIARNYVKHKSIELINQSIDWEAFIRVFMLA